jgi:hypothetical protein
MTSLAELYALLRNPFNSNQIRKVSLRCQDVDAFVFWTRNAEKLMLRLPELDALGYRYYFQYTITAYPRTIDRSVPNTHRAIETFIALSEMLGSSRVIWRYDPILVSNRFSIEEHKRVFTKIAKRLKGHTERVVISFADMYKRVTANLKRIDELTVSDIALDRENLSDLTSALALIASECGMSIQTCSEQADVKDIGIPHGKCIDDDLIRSIYSISVSSRKDRNQRDLCGCVESIDIGQYDTCLHGCQYCYATSNHSKAARNFGQHNPLSPFLVGEAEESPPTLFKGNKPTQTPLF